MNKLLAFTIFLGVLLHFSGVYFLQNMPLCIHCFHFDNAVAREDEGFAILERQRRSELLTHIFEHLNEEVPRVKRDLQDLKTEYAPSLELGFPSPSSEDLALEGCSLESDPLELSPIADGEIFLMKGSLLSPLPLLTTLETPPFAEVDYEDDPLDSFGSLAGSEHFDIRVEYAPKRSRPGYVFKVTFLPRSDVVFKRIRQNYYFLLDRSNSIPRKRYYYNKKAVAEALDFLKPGDRFNILVFDDRVVRLANRVVPWCEEEVARAREFLDRHGHGGFFAATELYASLGKIIPKDVAENEVNTAILLSDGDTYLTQEKQRLTIGRWTEHNKGKISLYTVASGTGNNLPLLDLLSSFNKGALVYAQDHPKVGDRIKHLMRTLQHPIGKDMVATAVTDDKQMSVLLQPKRGRIPDLYQNRPFVIYGSTNRLCDFVLFLQGKYYDRRFDIKKKISFDEATIGAYSIERGWTQLLVQEFYEKYFDEGKTSHLEAAKQLLTPLNLPTPLE